jgi:peptide/nickel transport system permease protein
MQLLEPEQLELPAVRYVSRAPTRMRRFLRHSQGFAGLIIIAVFLLAAIFAPLLAPPKEACARELGLEETQSLGVFSLNFLQATFAPPDVCFEIPRSSFADTPTPPGVNGHWLGTVKGYDILYGLIWGSRTAFLLGLSIVGCTFIVGLSVGLVAGYFGGWIDDLLMRVTEIVFSLPSLVLMIVLVTIFGSGLVNVAISIILVGWAGYARLIRGEVLRVRNLEYVEGARALGASDSRIILRHVLPNSLTTLTVQVALDFGSVVLIAAGLSFIGLGAPIGFADWGQLINFSQAYIIGPPEAPLAYWFVSFFPGLTILLWGLAWNLMGDALTDVLNPRANQ